MFYTVYKTTNKTNGKFYIGTHKTSNLDDKYLGSGKLLRRAIEKYGVDNFEREILHVFDTPAEMFAKEAEIVTADFLAEENCYNLKLGGEGGFDHLIYNEKKMRNLKRGGNIITPEMRQKAVATRKAKGYGPPTFAGRTHSAETKLKMSIARKQRISMPVSV